MKYRLSFSDFFVFLIVFVFLSFKLSTLAVRFGDGNVYIYAAHLLTLGAIPYRDFFVVVPPVLLYFLTPFSLIFRSNLIMYYLIPFIFESISAIFIYLILKKLKAPLAPVSALLYLFCFTIISTTDYLTGVFLVNFLSTAALLSLLNNRYVLSGVIFGLAIMTKFYALPIFAGVVLYLLINRSYKHLIRFCLATFFTCLAIITPFIILAPHQTITDLIIHQLHRPSGLNKFDVLTFFASKEIILLILPIGIFFIRQSQKWLFVLPLTFLAVFFLIFGDLYYLYLASLLPFLVIISSLCLSYLAGVTQLRQTFMIFCLIVLSLMIYQVSDYYSSTALLGRFDNPSEVADYINTLPQLPLYGNHDITPALALITHRPILYNIIDTNPQTFRSGANNIDTLSAQAVQQGTYLIARTINHPEIQINQIGFEDYFSQSVFATSCTKLQDFPSIQTEIYNQITIYRCGK